MQCACSRAHVSLFCVVRKPKVRDNNTVIVRHENIFRLQIAVNNRRLPAVKVCQQGAQLPRDMDDDALRNNVLWVRCDIALEVSLRVVFHHDAHIPRLLVILSFKSSLWVEADSAIGIVLNVLWPRRKVRAVPGRLFYDIEPVHEHVCHDDHVGVALDLADDVKLLEGHRKLRIVFAANVFERVFDFCFLVFDKENDSMSPFTNPLDDPIFGCRLLRHITFENLASGDERCRI